MHSFLVDPFFVNVVVAIATSCQFENCGKSISLNHQILFSIFKKILIFILSLSPISF